MLVDMIWTKTLMFFLEYCIYNKLGIPHSAAWKITKMESKTRVEDNKIKFLTILTLQDFLIPLLLVFNNSHSWCYAILSLDSTLWTKT